MYKIYNSPCIHNGTLFLPIDYCNCCDYSAIYGLPLSSGVSHTFNVCTGITEAPQACSCFNQSIEVNENSIISIHTLLS